MHTFSSFRQRMRLQPERTRGANRIKPKFYPPGSLVAAAMKLAMMSAAQGNCELVADFATKCPLLCEAQMMGI